MISELVCSRTFQLASILGSRIYYYLFNKVQSDQGNYLYRAQRSNRFQLIIMHVPVLMKDR